MYGLQDIEIEKIRGVLARYPEVNEAVLYGSRAMGTNKPYSDIDLTLKGDDISSTLQGRIDTELDDLLLPYFMDISVFDKLQNSDLTAHINRVGKVLYSKACSANS